MDRRSASSGTLTTYTSSESCNCNSSGFASFDTTTNMSSSSQSSPKLHEKMPGKASKKKEDKLPGTMGEFRCRFCGLSYNYMNTLKAHERVHNIDYPYNCGKCGDNFKFNSELQAHMLGHTSKKAYKCLCGRGFIAYSDYISHTCEKLDGAEAVRIDLEARIRGDRDRVYFPDHHSVFICQYCSKCFQDAHGLKYHMYGHRGEIGFRHMQSHTSRYLSTKFDDLPSLPGYGGASGNRGSQLEEDDDD